MAFSSFQPHHFDIILISFSAKVNQALCRRMHALMQEFYVKFRNVILSM